MKLFRNLSLAVLVCFSVAGCSLFDKLGKPAADVSTDPSVQRELGVVNLTGAITCLVVVQEGNATDKANLLKAYNSAKTVLNSDTPSFQALQQAFMFAGLPDKAKGYAFFALNKIQELYGDQDPVDKKTVYFAAMKFFVNGCGSAIGDADSIK